MSWTEVFRLCQGVDRLWDGSRTAIIALREPIDPAWPGLSGIPQELASFLQVSNGAQFYPWTDEGRGGVILLPGESLQAAQADAYLLAEQGDERRFFVAGEFDTTGNPLGIDLDGSVWFLDHEYGPAEWYQGKGAYRTASTLREFLLRLAAEKGRWWFLPRC